MRVMVLVKATDDSENGFLSTPEQNCPGKFSSSRNRRSQRRRPWKSLALSTQDCELESFESLEFFPRTALHPSELIEAIDAEPTRFFPRKFFLAPPTSVSPASYAVVLGRAATTSYQRFKVDFTSIPEWMVGVGFLIRAVNAVE